MRAMVPFAGLVHVAVVDVIVVLATVCEALTV